MAQPDDDARLAHPGEEEGRAHRDRVVDRRGERPEPGDHEQPGDVDDDERAGTDPVGHESVEQRRTDRPDDEDQRVGERLVVGEAVAVLHRDHRVGDHDRERHEPSGPSREEAAQPRCFGELADHVPQADARRAAGR